MSDESEALAGMELALELAKKLYEVSPDHELLKIFTDTDAVWEDFQKRFGKEGISEKERQTERGQAYFWASYIIAVRKAFEEKGINV